MSQSQSVYGILPPTRWNVDLGRGHLLQFTTKQGAEDRHTGALIWHQTTKTDTGWCLGGIAWENLPGETGPLWQRSGDDEHITISPNIHCFACGDHGFVRDGKWVRV